MVYLPVDSQMKTFYISINFIVALHVNMLQRLHLPVNSTYLIKPVKTSTLLSNWRENLIDVWNWFLWCKDEIQVLSQVSLKTPTWCAITTQATGVNNRKKSQKDVVHFKPENNHDTKLAKSEEVIWKITGSNKSWILLFFLSFYAK